MTNTQVKRIQLGKNARDDAIQDEIEEEGEGGGWRGRGQGLSGQSGDDVLLRAALIGCGRAEAGNTHTHTHTHTHNKSSETRREQRKKNQPNKKIKTKRTWRSGGDGTAIRTSNQGDPKKKNRSQSHQTKEIAPPPSIRGKRRRVIGCTVEMSFDRFFLDWIHLDPTELSSVALDRISRAYWVFTGFYLSLRRWTSISLGFSWVFHWGNFYWVLLGFTVFFPVFIGFYRFLLVLTGFLPSLTGLTRFYRVLLGFTGFYWVLLGFTGFYCVLPGFTGFYRVLLGFTGFYRVLLGFTGFYWVLLGFTGFYRVLLGFTGFYWVLPSFFVIYWVLPSCS